MISQYDLNSQTYAGPEIDRSHLAGVPLIFRPCLITDPFQMQVVKYEFSMKFLTLMQRLIHDKTVYNIKT